MGFVRRVSIFEFDVEFRRPDSVDYCGGSNRLVRFQREQIEQGPARLDSVELEAPKPAKEETPFERFKPITSRVVSVPRAEIQKRELRWKNDRKKHETHRRHR
jgi:hypothetical protein